MKILTEKQREWLACKKITIGNFTMFPRFGFIAYQLPDYDSGYGIETNPFTKSLDHEYFLVKEITENGFVRGNFYNRPVARDFYLELDELRRRGAFTSLILFILLIIPLGVYNIITRHRGLNTQSHE